MLLLSLLTEKGQLPGAGLTQVDKTCIQLNFYLEILKGGTWVSRGGQKPPPLNATLSNKNCIIIVSYTQGSSSLGMRLGYPM